MYIFVRKRKNKYVVCSQDENGKQKSLESFKLKRDALRKAEELRGMDPSQQLFSSFILDFLEIHKRNISITTYEVYERIIQKYILERLGKYKLSELTVVCIQDYIDELTNELKPQTVRVHINILRLALTRAYHLNLINKKLIDQVSIPKNKIYQNDIYSGEELRRLIELSVGTNLELSILLASTLGLRISEILGIMWEDIDFEKRILSIKRITAKVNGEVILKEPKTSSSIREIIIPNSVLIKLQKLKEEGPGVGLIFGKLISEDVVSQRFRRWLKKMGLKNIRFHDLRHSHVTLLMQENIPMKTISKRVGHATIDTTMKIYAHTTRSLDEKASEVIEEMMKD